MKTTKTGATLILASLPTSLCLTHMQPTSHTNNLLRNVHYKTNWSAAQTQTKYALDEVDDQIVRALERGNKTHAIKLCNNHIALIQV